LEMRANPQGHSILRNSQSKIELERRFKSLLIAL
jgi:hypothetical protein